MHVPLLTDTVRTIDGLLLDERVPERIENDDLGGDCQVETGVTRLERDEHDLGVARGLEAGDGFATVGRGHGAVVALVWDTRAVDGYFEQIEEGGKLAKDDCLCFC